MHLALAVTQTPPIPRMQCVVILCKSNSTSIFGKSSASSATDKDAVLHRTRHKNKAKASEINQVSIYTMDQAVSTILSAVLAVCAVILVILIGWFVVWKMFLVRFSFIRELVYGSDGSSKKTKRRSAAPETPLRRSSRIREKRQHDQHDE
ncbi:predicted protein [Nematostella vectensis]|uniref:Uncharacterized protein n=1 Tax=Nematostella vectensis TaxID=45351 RepID=A7RHE3_NEMVE|nr:predicted protein [Nematostella vectensis]|eukprot:XP_001641276.1 predicted protein [Nematostella vectensis]